MNISANEAVQKNQVMILDKLCKRFGGVVAADEVSLTLTSGVIHGLIGPNGSGKSTTMNLISGVTDMDSGDVFLDGECITKQPNHMRARLGVARTFQHPRLLRRCDIRTNLFLGIDLANMKDKSKLSKTGNISLEGLLDAAGLKLDMDDTITCLSYGQQKLFEIVRALLSRPKVVLLDEPAAGLNSKEMERVEALMNIAIQHDAAVLLVEHSMDLVMNICSQITVLNFGRQIAGGTPEEIQSNEAVIEAYLGRGRSA
ncbi:MAG: ABC transporter ATP-binding protein [Negativicutes bacterium]|nr:ABC transporter ATP-binding protein [Negativicutes bacterium]